jgi:hypothetical protein
MSQVPFTTVVEFDLQKTGNMFSMVEWLTNQIDPDTWLPERLADSGRIIGISFHNEADAVAFKLKFEL